jgi:hypothetical protein
MGPKALLLATLKLPPMLVIVTNWISFMMVNWNIIRKWKKAGTEVEVLMNHRVGHT